MECVIDQILAQKVDWKDDETVNYFILNFHSSKSAVETILYLKGHDDISNELLIDLRSGNMYILVLFILDTGQNGKH